MSGKQSNPTTFTQLLGWSIKIINRKLFV